MDKSKFCYVKGIKMEERERAIGPTEGYYHTGPCPYGYGIEVLGAFTTPPWVCVSMKQCCFLSSHALEIASAYGSTGGLNQPTKFWAPTLNPVIQNTSRDGRKRLHTGNRTAGSGGQADDPVCALSKFHKYFWNVIVQMLKSRLHAFKF